MTDRRSARAENDRELSTLEISNVGSGNIDSEKAPRWQKASTSGWPSLKPPERSSPTAPPRSEETAYFLTWW